MARDSVLVTLVKEDILNMIRGLPIPVGGIDRFTYFSGNQWNENWDWDMPMFNSMNVEPLWATYLALKEKVKSK